MKQLDLRNDILVRGKGHFAFEANGRRFAYAYIRKNACSAFKDLICETSNQADFSEYKGSQLEFMGQHHKIRSVDVLEQCDTRIFVYRDPFERVISVFVNKFVSQTGNAAIFQNYQEVTGQDPRLATFESFLRDYCRHFRDRDVHVERQSVHLLPIVYNAALSLSSLHTGMTSLIGLTLADRYFAHKVNSSSYGSDTSDMSSLTARQLHKRYKETRELPSKRAFMREDLIDLCRQRYAVDYEMIDALAD